MAMEKKFYLTTPIFYPNANLHLGHAYTTTLADSIARFHRLRGDATYLLTGSDENTQKVVEAAAKANVSPEAFLDTVVGNFRELFSKLDISYDQFIRTSDKVVHWPGAVLLWERLVEAGDIYKKKYQGLYCVGHEAFLTEKDLVEGKCPDHGTKPEFITEENYFFRLSKYTPVIKEKIERGELLILPMSRKNEILSLLSEGLEDVSFSRPRKAGTLGIPVPGDDSQVMYVWCDALSNYITALGFGREDDTLFRTFWPADLHIVGKDILRFHAAIWPGMLLSAGIPLPRALLVHGFITSGGKKMSKTLGNVIDPLELLAEYGTDPVRYYLLRHISPFEDSDLTQSAFRDAYNGELANGLGNLVSRVMKMATTHLEGPVALIESDHLFEDAVAVHIERYEINKALDLIFEHVGKGDEYVQSSEPFKRIKSSDDAVRAAAKEDIEKLVHHIYKIGVHLEPFIPSAALAIKRAVESHTMPPSLFPRKE